MRRNRVESRANDIKPRGILTRTPLRTPSPLSFVPAAASQGGRSPMERRMPGDAGSGSDPATEHPIKKSGGLVILRVSTAPDGCMN
jgi:hypothetical protein